MASHAGSRLLTDLAGVTGLAAALSRAVGQRRRRRSAHDPGRVLVDLAVMLADGGRGISLAVLRNRPELFGPVASTPTAWRVLAGIDAETLAAIRTARAQARERLWAQRSQCRRADPGRHCRRPALAGAATGGGRHHGHLPRDKELASPTFKGGFGYHPLMSAYDLTSPSGWTTPNEALAAVLRPGNAGSNTTADHVAVTDLALAQIPVEHRCGTPILVSVDRAGATKDWLTHPRAHRDRGVDLRFSVGSR